MTILFALLLFEKKKKSSVLRQHPLCRLGQQLGQDSAGTAQLCFLCWWPGQLHQGQNLQGGLARCPGHWCGPSPGVPLFSVRPLSPAGEPGLLFLVAGCPSWVELSVFLRIRSCHFCLIALAKARHTASPDSAARRIDFTGKESHAHA